MSDLTKLDIYLTIERDNLVVKLVELGRVNDSVIAESAISLEYLAEALAKHLKGPAPDSDDRTDAGTDATGE